MPFLPQRRRVRNRSALDAVTVTLGTSGKIVLVSGATLLLCFLMMLVLPVQLISSMGIAAGVTVFMAVTGSLTLTPTFLLTFPNFFSNSRMWGLSVGDCCQRFQKTSCISECFVCHIHRSILSGPTFRLPQAVGVSVRSLV